jgi:hypothetical protein
MLIGLGYKARVGKGEVAGYLCKHFGFTEMSFAGKLKQACAIIFGLSECQLYGNMKEILDPFWRDTPRNIMQKVGTECMRKGYRDDVWVQALKRDVCGVGGLAHQSRNCVVSDVRFPNEAEAIKSWGGVLVRVIRPDAPWITTPQHASETSLEGWRGWDHILDNGGDLPQLYARIEQMMNKLSGV